jgi:hypothetical protein
MYCSSTQAQNFPSKENREENKGREREEKKIERKKEEACIERIMFFFNSVY